MDQLQLLREQLPADPSEIESQLFSHFASELGAREGSYFGVDAHSEREEEIDIDIRAATKSSKKCKAENSVEINSRARPRKPHEPKPFLSIGNLTNNRRKLDPLVEYRQQSFVSNPNVPYNTPARMLQSQNSHARTMSVMSSDWNSVVPKRHKYNHGAPKDVGAVNIGNVHVLAPFKHNVSKSSGKNRRPLSPSQAMKDKTVMATHMVAKVMAKEKPQPSPRSAGRLLKGKLKPMTPVTVEGPKMSLCRGIQPQGQVYTASPSRTLQRRRHILSTLVAKDILNAARQERPATTESLHRTSVASDLEENRIDDFQNDVEHAENRAEESQEKESKQQNDIEISQGKKIKEPVLTAPIQSKTINSGVEPINVVSQTNMALTMAAIDEALETDLSLREKSFFVTDQEADDNFSKQGETDNTTARPKTAVDGQRKVRFKDTHGESLANDTRRSKSATARLIEETSVVKKGKANKKKQEEKGQGDNTNNNSKYRNDYDDDDNKDGGQGNQGSNHGNNQYSPSNNQGNNQYDSGNNGDCQGNTNNNGNQERQQVLRMSISDVKEGFQNPDIASRRGRPKSGRPKSKLGRWEDRMKPDVCIEALAIDTQKAENDMAVVEYNRRGKKARSFRYTLTSGNQTAFGRSRPMSAGPSSFRAAEKQRIISRARPQSASVYDDNMRIESYGAQLNNRNQSTNECYSQSQVQRPKSKKGRNKGNRYIDLINYASGDNERLYLSDVVQQTKAVICPKCGQTTMKTTDDECTNCTELEREKNNQQCKTRENDNDLKTEEQLVETNEALIMNMEDIEASLNEVQQEIRNCIENGSPTTDIKHKTEERPHCQTSTVGFMQSVLSMDDQRSQSDHDGSCYRTDGNNASSISGNISQYITGEEVTHPRGNTNITVYQYTEVSKPEDEDVNITADERNNPRCNEIEVSKDNNVSGSITTYDVNLVKPGMDPVYMELTNGGQGQSSMIPPSPYPPLCFHVNARPPEGYVYYFAYGIDMNPSRFSSYICRESADRFWGLLFGFKLRFNKKGLDKDAGGFPNIEYEKNSSVEGVLYLIQKEELALVDNSMGYPEYVEKVMMPVWFLNCTDPDELGVAQYCVPAITYVARDSWTLKDNSDHSTEYAVRQCVRAADLLSPAYKEYIISQIS